MTSNPSSFQEWLDSHGGATTLEQQLEMAFQLLQEALHDAGDPCEGITISPKQSASEMLERLSSSPICHDSLVTWEGIHVGWFLQVFCETPFFKHLCQFGCCLWFLRRVGMVVYLSRQHLTQDNTPNEVYSGTFAHHVGQGGEQEWDGPIVSKATVFVSYTGSYRLDYLVEMIEQLSADDYMWMDLFCVDQFAWTGKGRTNEMHQFREKLMDELQGQIKRISRTALLLEKWDNVMVTIGQIWVLWEVFNTAEAEAMLSVLLPKEEIALFLHNCLEDDRHFDTIQSSLASVDANKARAQDPQDYEIIHRRVKEKGLYTVNRLVLAKMRQWMMEIAQDHLQQTRQQHVDGPSPELLANVARLFQDQGRLQESEPLFREALKQNQNLKGSHHVCTLHSLNSLALLLSHEGKLIEAESLLQEAADLSCQHLGAQHLETLAAKNYLALVQKAQHKLTESEVLFREVLSERRQQLGDQHPKTLSSFNNLAFNLKTQGKLEEAEGMCRTALKGRESALGKSHPDALTSRNDLAKLCQLNGRTTEAEYLYREAVSGYRQQLGDHHPYSLAAIHNLASLLHSKQQWSEAELLYREALAGRQQVLGMHHSRTLASLHDLATLLQDQNKNLCDAEDLHREALDGRLTQLGLKHPDTLQSVCSLARLLKSTAEMTGEERNWWIKVADADHSQGNEKTDDPKSATERLALSFLKGSRRIKPATHEL